VPLPDGVPGTGPPFTDPLQDTLLERFGIEALVVAWPAPPQRLIRVSAQLYNVTADYERLATALAELLR
jgi:isopenicillin-N epimerase